MKNKILILILAGLFLPVFVFAEASYERTPAGYFIESPITIETDIATTCEGLLSWKMSIWQTYQLPCTQPNCYASECYLVSEPSKIWIVDLPAEEYVGTSYTCFSELSCVPPPALAFWLEYDEGNIVFEVVAEGPEYNILPSVNTTGILAYAGRIFTDLEGIVILLIGIPVGFLVIKKAIGLVKKRIK